jgi:hypothetical protein
MRQLLILCLYKAFVFVIPTPLSQHLPFVLIFRINLRPSLGKLGLGIIRKHLRVVLLLPRVSAIVNKNGLYSQSPFPPQQDQCSYQRHS